MKPLNKQRCLQPFVALVAIVGAGIIIFCVRRLPVHQLDFRFLILFVFMVALGARLIIHIPRIQGELTVNDTLIFLTMLLCGGEAAVLVAAVAACFSSLRVTKKIRVHVFNSTVMACSTFLTVVALRACFGSISALTRPHPSGTFVSALCVMAMVQYIVNSGLVTIYTGCKIDQPFWATWRKYYLWGSITYFAGASGAFIIAQLINVVGFYAAIGAVPIIAIVYFTYRTYLKNVENSAEQVERTKRHVEELNHYIAEQERIREQFTQVEKMSAIGELASGVAHDFNNTLAGILARAELALRNTGDAEAKRALEIIIKSAKDGAKTVKRIQDFARQRRDHDFAPVAVDQLLMDVNEITRPRWRDHAQANSVHIRLDLQIHTDAFVMGDASELREVLVNMVFNAVDAMPTGGLLTLSASERDSSVEISIQDTGTGMNAEIQSRVFNPFFTTKGAAGMGLGLAVCYGIIQRHEGTIEVESRPDQGTTFRIKLAVAEVKPGALTEIATGPRLTLVPSSNVPRILVVDDEECIRDLLSDILDSEGYEVTLAGSGSEALELFDTQSFKAVFTDVGMPGMSGWELARAIRERNDNIPLAVITGWGDAVSSTEQVEAGVDWVVAKPFSIDSITEIVAGIARRNGMQTAALPITATGT
jgi:signal transduction histidine kinase/ActR/RegA family two-component response regulator